MFRLIAMLEFENSAQAVDAWNQLLARATNTRIVGAGTSRAHTSYARVQGEGVFEQFFVDTFAIVRRGEYVKPPRLYPLWIQPTGAQNSYPALDAAGNPTRVEHNGRNWRNQHGNGNSWAPGVFGWEDLGSAG
jgi:hypothetical protein